ncbi:Aste57867_22478 [Aphanomyces stellatus]|uniref:Aste57867_22478 protein n=1 Tax=Aphanomyces stellatus TaxID=120398 RepID=A0A485LLI6_9STRA|nr:hypothetical protein As57867_022408 [Aphanomyces stellatus]VFT99138.1 Aste57867_22478 [Aphanomyces stellatus]
MDALRHGSLRYVLEVAPSMLRESDIVSDVLIERIRSEKEGEEGVNALLRLMSLHLQSNARVTEQLVELLYTSDFRLCIVHHLPKLTYQSKSCMELVIQAYRDLLESDGSLVVPILGSLADMPLTPDQQNDVVTVVHALMDSIDEDDMPAVVRGLLSMLTSTNGDVVIGSIRAQCHQLSHPTLLLVVEVMGRFLRSGSTSLKYILRAIRAADTLLSIDGLWLLLLLQQDAKVAWACMIQLGRKCTAPWLQSVAALALESPQSLLTPCVHFCMLVVQLAFHRATLLGSRHALVSAGVQTVAFLLQHTHGLAQQDVLVSLLTLATQSHKITNLAKQDPLRAHVAHTAAICIADSAAAIPTYGHLLLDAIHQLSTAPHVPIAVLDPLCFGLVQLIPHDRSLYSLVLLTIQKHIFVPSPSQVTAMLLAAHLSYAQQLEAMDQRAIAAWMRRLLPTVALSLVPFVCAFLCVQPDRRPRDVVPALVRRGVLAETHDSLAWPRFLRHLQQRQDQDGPPSTTDLDALLDMVFCLVVSLADGDDGTSTLLDTLVEQLTSSSADQQVDERQCQLMATIGLINGLHHTQHRRAGEAIPKLVQRAYDLATSLEMVASLVHIQQPIVLALSHEMPLPSLHVLYQMLDRTTTGRRWQLYGTYAAPNAAAYLPHLPTWLARIVEFGHHEQQPTHAETLLQLYAIVLHLLDHEPLDVVVHAMAPDAADARAYVYSLLQDQATEQLQDAQAIVPLLDLLVRLSTTDKAQRETARLAQSVLSHVFPDAALDTAVWKAYLGRPAALQHLKSTTLLTPPSPFLSRTHYMYHAMVTAYALHPQPLIFFKDMLTVLDEMVQGNVDHCHPTYRSITTDTFRHVFTTYWLCLLNFCPLGAHVTKHRPATSPYASSVHLFALLESSFAFVPRANTYNAEASLAQKTYVTFYFFYGIPHSVRVRVVLMLRACQIVCEQMIKCVDRCLRWRQGLDVDDRAGDIGHLSPLLHQMEFVLTAMEDYVQGMQRLALAHLKEATKPTKTKLQLLVKKQKTAQPLPQIKFMPQVLRWIQRTKDAIAKTQMQYSIPPGSDMDLQELLRQTPSYDWTASSSSTAAVPRETRWDAAFESEEEKEEEYSSGQEEDGDQHALAGEFHTSVTTLRTDVDALKTPQKKKEATTSLLDNDEFGFPSIVIDFSQMKKSSG